MRYVKIFIEDYGIKKYESEINNWLKENDDKEIINIIQNQSSGSSASSLTTTIFYSDNSDKIIK